MERGDAAVRPNEEFCCDKTPLIKQAVVLGTEESSSNPVDFSGRTGTGESLLSDEYNVHRFSPMA
jgi:hypothetical protein